MTRFLFSFIFSIVVLSTAHAFEPTDQYEEFNISGWKIYLSSDYNSRERQRARALQEVEKQLDKIIKALPSSARHKLQKVPIWIEYKDGRNSAGQYHFSKKWLEKNGYNPDKAKAVEMNYNMVRWRNFQPWIVLHELAHAYHYLHIGLDNKQIKHAYEKAQASGDYDDVLRTDGTRWRAYSMTNAIEYFAELTEAYFGANEDEPYDRKALQKMDRDGYEMVRDLWRKR